jgi:hypothetical protein
MLYLVIPPASRPHSAGCLSGRTVAVAVAAGGGLGVDVAVELAMAPEDPLVRLARLALRATTLGLSALLGAGHHVRGDGKGRRTTDHQRRITEEYG